MRDKGMMAAGKDKNIETLFSDVPKLAITSNELLNKSKIWRVDSLIC